jgi:hypothetical protein
VTHLLPGPVSRRDSGERVAVIGLGLTAYLADPTAWAQGGLVTALDEVRAMLPDAPFAHFTTPYSVPSSGWRRAYARAGVGES